MIVSACGMTHTGNIREHNEDNIYVRGRFRNDLSHDNVIIRSDHQDGPPAFAVFDGLGGGSYGEEASRIAAEIFQKEAKSGLSDPDAYVAETHRAIRHFAEKNGVYSMGTTAAVLQITDERAYVFNVGDSRVYLFRNGQLTRLTRDHSMIQSMIDSGLVQESDRESSPFSGDLTQFLGMKTTEGIEPEAYVNTISIQPGDLFILCSDGLTRELDEDGMSSLLREDAEKGAGDIALDLMFHAVKKGKGRDNVSVIAVAVN
ncbi:MAG: serine/threonine-protein phosphatase [Mogibacterium sp.]|nr:serine/threonine-protein phosphatase [Mogibacterium sp.]